VKQTRSPYDDIVTLDLMGKDRMPHAVARVANPVVSPPPFDPSVTIAHLQQNYKAILDTRAIFAPVAYRFLCEIGSGRQGSVWSAQRHGARGCITRHAVKLFDPGLYRAVEEYWTDMGRIAHQVGQLQPLQSPNLVATDSYEETNGIGFVQMEAIDGLDIGRLMTHAALERAKQAHTAAEWSRLISTLFRLEDGCVCFQPGVAVHILRAVLRGLDRVHTLHFLHADIKPTNIMIDRLGGVKLVDFGRAVLLGEKATFLLGSPRYMAPETHRREAGTVQSDCYSVGLVALQMLTGREIGENANSEDELLQIKMKLPALLAGMLPPTLRANGALIDILQKFLAPDPAQRYASAEMAETGDDGLKVISRQLVRAGLDTEYERELAHFMAGFAEASKQDTEVVQP